MPIIVLKQPGQPVADFSVSGPVVTVAGVTVDCAARQRDVAELIEIRGNSTGPSEGGNGAYLAQISIPARRYTTVTVAGIDGEPDTTAQVPEQLDPDAVLVTLWPTV